MVDTLPILELSLNGFLAADVPLKGFINRVKKNRQQGLPEELVALVLVELDFLVLKDARLTFGELGMVIRYLPPLNIEDFPKIAAEIYRAILLVLRELKREGFQDQPLSLALLAPLALNFQLGQALGFHHNVQFIHWNLRTHNYELPPSLSRNMLETFSFQDLAQQQQLPSSSNPILAIDFGDLGVFFLLRRQFGAREVQIITYPITPLSEMSTIVCEVYHKVVFFCQQYGEVSLVLSGPQVLYFQLGQALGFDYKVKLYEWQRGRYFKVPPLTREMLTASSTDASSPTSSE